MKNENREVSLNEKIEDNYMLAIAYPKISSMLLNVDVSFTYSQVEAMNKFFEKWENAEDIDKLNERIKELTRENDELSDKVDELDREIDNKDEEIISLKNQIKELGGVTNENN